MLVDQDRQLMTTAQLRAAGLSDWDIECHVRDRVLVPVHRGIYASGAAWQASGPDARYLAKILGVVRAGASPAVVSHLSAAALHRLPITRAWPERVHMLTPGAAGGSSSRLIRTHREIREVECEIVDGVVTTSLASTLADVAIAYPLEISVPMLDHALHRLGAVAPAKELIARVADARLRRGRVRGSAHADQAIAFADAFAESPGESLSRVVIHRGGFAAPNLQTTVSVEGRPYRVDFAWPGVIGEFDGKVKYVRDEYRAGRTQDQVFWDEKRREDAIRLATRCGFVRWGFEELREPVRLWNRLTLAGVHRPRAAAVPRARPRRSGTPS